MPVSKWFGLILKIILGVVCAVFVGSESMAFFNFIFPASKWYLAYTGFGLTMGAFIVYLYLLLKDAETPLQKTIALLMMVVGLSGELATAGFGMYIEGWSKLGWQPKPEEYNAMILAIRIMMGIHGVCLVLYWFGDRIIELLGDHDDDGTINALDPDYKPAEKKQNKGSGIRWPWQKKAAPEPVRQFNAPFSDEQIAVLKVLIGESQVGQGSVNENGKAKDFTNRQSQK